MAPPAVGIPYTSGCASRSAATSASAVRMKTVEPSSVSATGPLGIGTAAAVRGVTSRSVPSARRSNRSCWASVSPASFSELAKMTSPPLALIATKNALKAPLPADSWRREPSRRRS